MSLRSKLGMFVLTRQEQRTIAFVVLALVLGLWTKHYRAKHPRPLPNEVAQRAAATPSASTTPAATTAPR